MFRSIRSVFAGLLGSYGFIAFFSFILVATAKWTRQAPMHPIAKLGQTFPVNVHGTLVYYTAYQVTAASLMFALSIPLVFLAAIIAPKQRPPNDEANDVFWAAVAGALGTPPFLWFAGPVLVSRLNEAGIVFNWL